MSTSKYGCRTLVPASLLALLLNGPCAFAQDDVRERITDPLRRKEAVQEIRASLARDPRGTVERLNSGWLEALCSSARHEEVTQLVIAGSVALPNDTWAVEQLHRHRVRALQDAGRHKEALAAGKSLFLVAGMGSVTHDLELLGTLLRRAHPDDPTIVHRFKLQQLAGAQEEPGERQTALARVDGKSILDSIPIDPKPYADAIQSRSGRSDYASLYGTGNLLLLSGRIPEAREAFQKAYDVAPPGEINYASEGLAKVLKAEDLAVGRANAFVKSIRPNRREALP
jgi:tetratricopeptide (TPR) repeat protein